MFKAAQLDDNDVVVGISDLKERFTHPRLVWLNGAQTDVMGKKYNRSTRKFEDLPAEPEPQRTREDLYRELAQYRNQRERGGVEVNGVTVRTESESVGKLIGSLVALDKGMVSTVNWKGTNGWLNDATAQTMAQVASAVANHIQDCFTAERDVSDQIAALTESQIPGFDIPIAWQSVGGP